MKLGQTPAETNMEKILDQRVSPQFKMVNDDKAFKAGYRWVGAASGSFIISNPTTDVEMFIIGIEVWTFANTHIDYYLDPTYTDGTAITPTPYRLGSGATSQMQVIVNPTVSDTGTHILPDGVPGGQRWFAQGGSNEGLVGFILLPGHSLLVQITVTGATSTDFGFIASWWEIKSEG